jgi:hypothetical protein
MENFTVTVQKGNHIYDTNGTEWHGTAYEEFLRWRPNASVLGAAWYDMFADAIRSLLLNTESVQKIGITTGMVEEIIMAARRYAAIYLSNPSSGDRAMYIFRGVLMDIMRKYDYGDCRFDNLIEGFYQKIMDLVKV